MKNSHFVATGALRGFTLIELLVVIAIIGILSSVVLASLNTARSKGSDAGMKSNLANMRAQAELFASGSSSFSYDGVCATSGTNTIGNGVSAAEKNYRGAASTYADGTASTWNTGQCHDSTTSWVAWVPYKDSSSGTIHAFCVDANGTAKDEAVVLGASVYACP